MMNDTNVKLSKNELDIVTNSTFILTKNRIISKVYDLFGAVSEAQKNEIHACKAAFSAEIFAREPKIYKGEQYQGLPYVMMDYPRSYTKKDVLAIRNFFWWGNFFSISLHLSGKYQQQYSPVLWSNLNQLKDSNWFIYTGDDPWLHDFEGNDYKRPEELIDIPLAEILKRPFIKISRKIPLQEWDKAYEFFTTNYAGILKMMMPKEASLNFPGGETSL